MPTVVLGVGFESVVVVVVAAAAANTTVIDASESGWMTHVSPSVPAQAPCQEASTKPSAAFAVIVTAAP